jgi:hypothetical protein
MGVTRRISGAAQRISGSTAQSQDRAPNPRVQPPTRESLRSRSPMRSSKLHAELTRAKGEKQKHLQKCLESAPTPRHLLSQMK